DRAGLALEAGQVAARGVVQDLDRDVAAEPPVVGPEHGAHAARADARPDHVRTEAAAGREVVGGRRPGRPARPTACAGSRATGDAAAAATSGSSLASSVMRTR